MNRFITIFPFIFVVFISKAQVEHTFGLGAIIAHNSDVSYINYLPDRAPYEVIPPAEYRTFYPIQYRMRIPLKKMSNGTDVSLTFPVGINGFYTNDDFKKNENFLVMQVPLLISYRISENSFGKKLGIAAFVSAGGAWLRTSGQDIGERSQFDPYAEAGLRKEFGRFGIGLTYAQNFVFDEPIEAYPFGSFLNIEAVKWKTQTISLEASYKL